MKTNPYWGKLRPSTARASAAPPRTRRAPRATTATCTPTATWRRRRTRTRPALAVGVWMGNSDNDAERRQPLARYVGAAVVGAPRGGQRKDTAIVQVQGAGRARDRDRRRLHGPQARSVHEEDRQGAASCKGTVPTERETIRVSLDGRRRLGPAVADGCVGPKVERGFFDLSRGREQLPGLAEGQPQLGRARSAGARASRGPRRAPGPPTSTTADSVRSAARGARRSPRARSARSPRRRRSSAIRWRALRPASRASRRRPMTPRGGGGGGGNKPPKKTPKPPRRLTPDGPRQRLTIVAPSPPSPRSPGRADRTNGCVATASRTASRSAPVPIPWMIVTLPSPARLGVVQVATERLERLLDAGPAQVQATTPRCGRDRVAGPSRSCWPPPPAVSSAGDGRPSAGSRSSRSTSDAHPAGLERRAQAALVHRGDAAFPAARAAARPVADLPLARV